MKINYARVIEAELAAEALAEIEAEKRRTREWARSAVVPMVACHV